MTTHSDFPAADLQRLIALVEQNHERIEKLFEAVMGDGNPRDSIVYRLQACEHQVQVLTAELSCVHSDSGSSATSNSYQYAWCRKRANHHVNLSG